MKQLIVDLLKKVLKDKEIKLSDEELEKYIEIPPSSEMGDYAFPCFFIAKELKQDPHQVAMEIREKIGEPPLDFEDIQTSGGYVNFFLDRKDFARKLLEEILKKKENFGKSKIGKGKRTIIEFPSPNTNKPLHLGHLRNLSIGDSISRINEFNGEKVIRANLNNDRGIHICKSMVAYEKFGKNKTPKTEKKKSDHFVGDYYVLFHKKSKNSSNLEVASHRMLQKWEKGDKKVLALWKKMNKWAYEGFNETYKKFGIKHDIEFFESEIYKKGREIVEKGLTDKIFKQKKDKSIIVDLKKEKLGEKVLLRMDGTSLYIVQDLYLAKLKFDKYKLDKSIHVVANEQNYHFNVLFAILKKLKFDFADKLHHLSYGMVNLPEGKMKSREGKVVDADDLIENVQKLIKKELSSREKLSKNMLEEKSLKIALSSIKYFLLKVDSKKNMLFNPKESISFEGDTGPYLLYSYARASSILRKAKNKKSNFNIKSLDKNEIELVKKLSQFPEVVLNSYNNLNPSLIANYSHQLAQIFNEFYHSCQVIGSEEESFRTSLVEAFRYVLKNSLNLLGVETLEKM